jgi:hypothetical protein
MAAPASAG